MSEAFARACRKESVKIAKSFRKVLDDDFSDEAYNKHDNLRKKSFLSDKSINAIEHYVTITPKEKFREIDVHQFDTVRDPLAKVA